MANVKVSGQQQQPDSSNSLKFFFEKVKLKIKV
jgi:hypothetical protein